MYIYIYIYIHTYIHIITCSYTYIYIYIYYRERENIYTHLYELLRRMLSIERCMRSRCCSSSGFHDRLLLASHCSSWIVCLISRCVCLIDSGHAFDMSMFIRCGKVGKNILPKADLDEINSRSEGRQSGCRNQKTGGVNKTP